MPAVRKAVDLSIGVKMNVRNIIIGIVFIAIGIWFYVALSTFEVEEGTTPKRIVIREGGGIMRVEQPFAISYPFQSVSGWSLSVHSFYSLNPVLNPENPEACNHSVTSFIMNNVL
jgi:hypothetical protein